MMNKKDFTYANEENITIFIMFVRLTYLSINLSLKMFFADVHCTHLNLPS
jgi:hypothetical protein